MSGLVEYGSSDEEDAPQQVLQPLEALNVRNFNTLAGRFPIKLLTVQTLGPSGSHSTSYIHEWQSYWYIYCVSGDSLGNLTGSREQYKWPPSVTEPSSWTRCTDGWPVLRTS